MMRVQLVLDLVAVAVTALLWCAAVTPAEGQGTAPRETRTFEIVAKRFTFEPAQIEVTEGDRVRLVVTSADGVHGVEIKKFKAKRLVPRGGEAITIEFDATAAGTYEILCSEYCGKGHEDMKGTLVVKAREKGN